MRRQTFRTSACAYWNLEVISTLLLSVDRSVIAYTTIYLRKFTHNTNIDFNFAV